MIQYDQTQDSEKPHISYFKELINRKKFQEVSELLAVNPTVEISEFLEELEIDEIVSTLKNFPIEDQGKIFSEFYLSKQIEIFHNVEIPYFSVIFTYMASDVRADLFQKFSKEEQLKILPFLPKEIRHDVMVLSSYPPETAGGIMNTNFVTLEHNLTVQESIEIVRKEAPNDKMLYYAYVVDSNMGLLGIVSLKDLVVNYPKVKLGDIMEDFVIYVNVNEDQESVAKKIEKYSLIAIPVLNDLNQIVGIVNHEDAMEVIREEENEDLEKFMGIIPDDAFEYLATPVSKHFKKRIVWLVSLAILGLVSGLIMHEFESTLQKFIILALYMPMIADTGGNSGSQAATVVIRSLALNHFKVSDWGKVMWKETKISILLALVLGILTYGKVYFLSQSLTLPPEQDLSTIAFVIGFALSLQVVTSTMIGSALPLVVKKWGGDPAIVASPAITTIVDISGLLIYFGTAFTFLI